MKKYRYVRLYLKNKSNDIILIREEKVKQLFFIRNRELNQRLIEQLHSFVIQYTPTNVSKCVVFISKEVTRKYDEKTRREKVLDGRGGFEFCVWVRDGRV